MKRVWIAIVIVFVALAGVIGWQVLKPAEPEPVYNGKTLTSWLEPLGWMGSSSSEVVLSQQGEEAIRQAGTNAIPTLLRLLRKKDSAFKIKVMALLSRQRVINVRYIPAEDWNMAALVGLRELGTNAQAAVPDLIEIASHHKWFDFRKAAMITLRYVGPPAKQAVPYLLQCSQYSPNTGSALSDTAREALYHIDPEAAIKAGITNVYWYYLYFSPDKP